MRGHSTNPAAIEAEIAHLRSLALDALRRHWRVIFGRPPPADLSKDLLGRMIAYRLQERAFGGLDFVVHGAAFAPAATALIVSSSWVYRCSRKGTNGSVPGASGTITAAWTVPRHPAVHLAATCTKREASRVLG